MRSTEYSSNHPIEPETLNQITEALDEIIDTFLEDNPDIFGTESQRLGGLYKLYAEGRKRRNIARNCVYPGCNEKSVKSSHAIQNSGTLALIAEDNHVLTPEMDINSSQIEMKLVGVNEASTFPGFCNTHEQEFGHFERSKSIDDEKSIALQVFRTICREVVNCEIHLENLKAGRDSYEHLANIKMIDILKQRGNTGMKSIEISSYGKVYEYVQHHTGIIEAVLDELKTAFINQALADIKGEDNGLAHIVLTVDKQIPICLAGMGNFIATNFETTENIRVILNVIPSLKSTKLIISAKEIYKDWLMGYLQRITNSTHEGILKMLETWMINGSDHWFIRPSTWHKMPESLRRKLLDDINDHRFHILNPYPTTFLLHII